MWVWIEKSVSYGDDDGDSRLENSGNAINGFLKLCAMDVGLGFDEVCANLTDEEDEDDAEGAPYCDSTKTDGLFLWLVSNDGGEDLKDGSILIVALSVVGGP